VADLKEWGQVAANSPEFAKAVVTDYWKTLVGDAPRPEEAKELEALVSSLMSASEANWRVETMLKALIRTEAYGVP